MPLVKVAQLSELLPDTVTEVVVGEQPYAVCNIGGSILVVDGVCPHAGGPLGQGVIRDGRIVCPFHFWEFDAASGACAVNPDLGLAKYVVRISAGDVLLELP